MVLILCFCHHVIILGAYAGSNMTRLSGLPPCAFLSDFMVYGRAAVGALLLSATVVLLVPRDDIIISVGDLILITTDVN